MPIYGGECKETGFCEKSFLDLQFCIEPLMRDDTCPDRMVSMEQVIEGFSTYDYRIDVRSQGEWDEGHAQLSIHTPGLALNKASNYLDLLAGKEDANILVYCRSGGRAFEASHNLMRYGFKKISSFYHGGFPNLEARIVEENEGKSPSKSYCYIKGSSDPACPIPLPFAHIPTVEHIKALGDKVVLIDVRTQGAWPDTLSNAIRVPAKKSKKFVRYSKPDVDRHVLVLFCNEGNGAFAAGKEMVKYFEGKVYFIDHAGYEQIKMIDGIEDIEAPRAKKATI